MLSLVKDRTRALLAMLILAACAAVLAEPHLRWRVELIALHFAGKIPDIGLGEMIAFIMPGSEQPMIRLVGSRNPHAVIKNFHTSRQDIAAGATLYRAKCARCHAPDGLGGTDGPALAGSEYTRTAADWALYRAIRLGVPQRGMPAHPLPSLQLWQLVAFVRSIDAGTHDAAREPPMPEMRVAAEELARAEKPATDWLTYSGSYTSTRHSALTQITPENVAQLTLRWQHQFEGEPGKVESSPIVRNGVMFVTAHSGRVMAVDARTGKRLWTQQAAKPATGSEGELAHNRGVAILGDTIYMGTGDAHLIARSASTGQELWNVATGNGSTKYYISSAPLALRDMVVTGVGTRYGGVAYLAAFDAKTGKERWRFNTIPGPGEKGHETWSGDSWREGGAPTWLTGSYDVEHDMLFWGVGNPKPDYDGELRAGDNLYSNSVIALQASTGKLLWYYQFTPADDRDWDSNQIPVLADRTTGSTTEHLLLWANRNGFYYVLDRLSGKFLGATPFVRVTWTDGIGGNGRPLPRHDQQQNRAGFLVYPGVGGTNWWSPSYDAALGLMFVPVLEQGRVFFPSPHSWPRTGNDSFYTAIRALEARTGRLVWEFRRPPRRVDSDMGSVMTTDSGVLFGSDRSTFFALDSRTGRMLWSVETGGTISSPPVTYAVDGRQLVVISAGRNLMAFGLPASVDTHSVQQ